MRDAAVTALRELDGRIWLGSRRGLLVSEGESWRPVSLQAPGFNDGLVTFVQADHERNLWVGTEHGVVRVRDGQPREWVDQRSPAYIQGPLSGFADREGNLWIGR